MAPNSVLETASLPEFFREKVCTAIHDMDLAVSQHAEFYLVNLLTTFSKTDKLFDKDENGDVKDKALALQLFDALLATPNQRLPILKKMGDMALYISGFFGDSLFRKMVDIKYYINMGHTAYSSASRLLPEDMRGLFEELAGKFPQFVDVLSQVAESAHLSSDRNLLKLYERWIATGSVRAKELLTKEGLIPLECANTKYNH